MKKIDLGQSLTILANIGVIAGIGILAIEISQNTRAQEVGAYQALMERIARLNEMSIENPQAFALNRQHAQSALEDLNPEEYQIVTSNALLVIRLGDMAFHQFERGLIGPDRLQSALGPLLDNVCRRSFQESWAEFRNNYVEAYRGYVEERIDECDP